MSAYLCSQNEINAIATYAADHELVADAKLFADLLTLTNVKAMQTRYPGREWLQRDVIDVAAGYVFERVEWSAHCVAEQAKAYDYQACEVDDYDATLCARLVNRVLRHAENVAALEQPGGCGAARHYPDDYDHDRGCFYGEDTPALDTSFHDGEMDVDSWADHAFEDWCATVERILSIATLDGDEASDGYSLDYATDAYNRHEKPEDYAAMVRARWALERPGGCGAARLAVIWTAKSSNKKTGPMPVSTTSSETCPTDCPFKRNGCYAEQGNLGFLWRGLDRAGPNASWQSGVARVRSTDWRGLCVAVAALPEGTLWRHNQAGDLPHRGGKIDRARVLELVRANRGKRGFTYTHHNVAQSLDNARVIQSATLAGFTINLSGNTLAHADALADLGVAPVVCVLPCEVQGNVKLATPKGRRVVVCPATYQDDVTCKTCGLCAVAGRGVIIGFPAHGAGARRASAIAGVATVE